MLSISLSAYANTDLQTASYEEAYASQDDLISTAELPSRYISRDDGKAVAIENQEYNICVAHAANSMVSGYLAEDFPGLELSPYHTAYFSKYGGGTYISYTDYFKENTFEGAHNIASVAAFAAWRGPVYSYRMTKEDIADIDSIDESLRDMADFHVQDFALFSFSEDYYQNGFHYKDTDISEIEMYKRLILDYGQIGCCYNTSVSMFDCFPYYSHEYNSIYIPDNMRGNHVVAIVGWDDNFPKESFKDAAQPENDGAWLIKGSWGTNCFDEGYYWISYEDKSLILQYVVTGVESKDNYANIYQRDYEGLVKIVAPEPYIIEEKAQNYGYMATVYTAQEDEQLEAVSFYTTDFDSEYEISVYLGGDGEDPTSGTLVTDRQSGSEAYPGYHTIELDKAVALPEGEAFWIVIKLTNPENKEVIPVSGCLYYDNMELLPQDASGYGLISADMEHWNDMSFYNHGIVGGYFGTIVKEVCIKAFTNPLPDSGEAVSNVRFSELEGATAKGQELYLSGADTIYYTLTTEDGTTSPVLYSDDTPIILLDDVTVSAWSESDDGNRGNTVTREYTGAKCALQQLVVYDGMVNEQLKINETNEFSYEDDRCLVLSADDCDDVYLCPRATGNITINGEEVRTGDRYKINIEQLNVPVDFVIELSEEGKESSRYTVTFIKTPVTFDENGIAAFDEERYTMTLEGGIPVTSGMSVMDYASNYPGHSPRYYIYDLQTGEVTGYYLPVKAGRGTQTYYEALYVNEYGCLAADNPEMSGAKLYKNDYFKVAPGQTIYLQSIRSRLCFGTPVRKVTIAARPAAPEISVEEVGADYIAVSNIEGCEYSTDGESWQTSNVLKNLTPDTEYTIYARYHNTGSEFASERSSVETRTEKGAKITLNYYYNGYFGNVESFYAKEGTNVYDVFDILGIDTDIYKIAPEYEKYRNLEITVAGNEDGVMTADTDVINIDFTLPEDTYGHTYAFHYFTADGTYMYTEQIPAHAGYFEKSEIPVPDGYRLLDSSITEDNATRLLYYDFGAYIFEYGNIAVILQKKPVVTITLMNPDGTVYKTIEQVCDLGENIIELPVPEGYMLEGGNTLIVTVTEDENYELTADVAADTVLYLKAVTNPDDSKPEDSKPEDSKPEDNKPDDSKPDDNKPEDSKPDDNKPEDCKPDDNKPDDSKSEIKNPETGVRTDSLTFVIIGFAAVCTVSALRLGGNRKKSSKKD